MNDFVDLYLKRIGCENAVEPSAENLARLQEAPLLAHSKNEKKLEML